MRSSSALWIVCVPQMNRTEPQVVVGAQVQDFACTAVRADIDSGLLRSCDQSFLLEQALGFKCFSLDTERLEK